MALEISVGPPRLAITQGYGVLITDQDGQIPWPTDKGFFHRDTRVISSWQIFADGQPWDLLNSGNIAYYASCIFLMNRALQTESGEVAAGSLGLSISRSIAGGVHEDLDLVNRGMSKVQFNLEIAVRSDFADLFEVKSGDIVRRGRIASTWSQRRSQLKTSYFNEDFERHVTTTVDKFDSKPVYANGRISFQIELEAGEAWHSCLLYAVGDGKDLDKAPDHCISEAGGADAHRRLADWRAAALKIETSNEELYRFYHQSLNDMAALRLPIEGTDHLEFVPAGGVPWFVALFGRDCLIVSLQNAMVYPEFAKGALEVLSRYQAEKRDNYRDAEPGKIMHELRRGELAHLKLIPHTPYYGTADATILYLTVLHNAWRCTGSMDLLKRFLPAAEKCLTWIDNYGDRDGDGFQEYETRSTAGYANQGWKDSGEALVYPDGSLVNALIALGFRRYGFAEEANRIARDISGAAGYFMCHQIPELYSGLQRDPTNFPVQYRGANVPQAWAAGSCFSLLQMIIGFQPDAPAGKLYIDPALPEWLPVLTVRDLHVGSNVFDLRFWRNGGATRFEVLNGDATAVVQRSYATATERWV